MDRPRLAVLLAALLLLGGCSTLLGGGDAGPTPEERDLRVRWTGETTSTIQGNHHVPAAARVDGKEVIAVPLGGHHGESGCALVVLDGEGRQRWRAGIAPEACTLHAVADPAFADFDGDGELELLAATTEHRLVAYDPLTGDVKQRFELGHYGYTRPVVADLAGDAGPETLVADAKGNVTLWRPNGDLVWQRSFDAYVWGQPTVADFSGDGAKEVVFGTGDGRVVALGADGETTWEVPTQDAVTWMTTGALDDDPAREVVAATVDGQVLALDGRDGSVEWERDLGAFASVGGPDGSATVFAAAKDGVLRALDGRDGSVAWRTNLTDADVQMTPPPVVGDVTGDGNPEVVVLTNDGRLLVVDPETGTVLASHERDVSVWTHPTLADLDGDGTNEIYVVYGDGRTLSFAVD